MVGIAPLAPGLGILHKADAVLHALEQHTDLAVTELSALIDEPVSSLYRILTSLTVIGWVEPSPARGRYRLGLDVMRIGGAVEDRLSIRAHALPVMTELHAGTDLTVYLCVRRFTRSVCIERIEGRDVRSLTTMIGSSTPLFAGAAPRVLLATLPDADRDQVVSGEFRLDPNDPQVPPRDAIRADTVAVRQQGYAISDGDVTPGVAAIGAPVRDHRGDVIAAVSVSGLRPAVLGADLPSIVDAVIAGAAAISASLGFHAAAAAATAGPGVTHG
jgi:DNA-binding IclR family transcriptional regulator